MNKEPILVVDDNLDNQESLQEAWKDLKYTNRLFFLLIPEDNKFFETGKNDAISNY